LQDEIFGKPILIPLHGPVEGFGFHFIELCQIGSEHDLVAANKVYLPFDDFERNGGELFSVRFLRH
jgi:hypothetical protein